MIGHTTMMVPSAFSCSGSEREYPSAVQDLVVAAPITVLSTVPQAHGCTFRTSGSLSLS